MVNVFVLASFLDKVQPIWLSSFTLKFFKVPSPRKSSSQKPKLASQHSSKLLNLKITIASGKIRKNKVTTYILYYIHKMIGYHMYSMIEDRDC